MARKTRNRRKPNKKEFIPKIIFCSQILLCSCTFLQCQSEPRNEFLRFSEELFLNVTFYLCISRQRSVGIQSAHVALIAGQEQCYQNCQMHRWKSSDHCNLLH